MLGLTGSIKDKITSLGLALILTAIPVGMYAKILLGFMHLNSILFIVGILLLFPYKTFFSGRLKFTGLMFGCMAFTIYAIINQYMIDYYDKSHYLYNGLVLLACLSLAGSEYEEDFSMDNVIRWTWLISFFNAVLTIYVIMTGLYGVYAEYDPYQTVEEALMYDGLTAGSCCIMNIACSLYLLSSDDNKYNSRYLLIFLIILDIFAIILTQKRTPLIVSFFIIGYYIYYNDLYKAFLTKRNVSFAIAIFLAGVFVVLLNENIFNLFVYTVDHIISGISDLVYGTEELDITNSTSIRYYNRLEAYDILSKFDAFQYVFGAGYMTMWVDIPLLQSYMDLGIIGFLLFAYYRIILPAKVLFGDINYSPILMWAVFITCYGMLSCLNSGHPYGHTHWIPSIVLIFVVSGLRAQPEDESDEDDIEDEPYKNE